MKKRYAELKQELENAAKAAGNVGISRVESGIMLALPNGKTFGVTAKLMRFLFKTRVLFHWNKAFHVNYAVFPGLPELPDAEHQVAYRRQVADML